MKAIKKYLLSAVGIGLAISFIILGTMIAIIASQGKVVTEDGKLESTGIIRINSNITNFETKINGETVKINNNHIEYLSAGPVLVSISKAGFVTWQKQVIVKANEVIDIYPNLILSSIIPVQINEQKIDNAALSPNSEYVFYTVLESKNKDEIGFYRLKLTKGLIEFGENTPKLISNFNSDFTQLLNENKYVVTPSYDGSKVFIDVPSTEEIYYFDAGTTRKGQIITEDIGFYPQKLQWFDGSASLILEQNGNIFEYQINSKLMSVVMLSQSQAPVYTVGWNKVFYVKPDKNQLMVYKNRVSEELKLAKNFIYPSNIVSLTTAPAADYILLINSDSGVIYINTENLFFEIVDKKADEVLKLAENGLGFLYLTEDTIGAYYLDTRKFSTVENAFGTIINTGIVAPNNPDIVMEKNLKTFYWMETKNNDVILNYSDIEGTNINMNVLGTNYTVVDFILTPDGNDIYFLSSSDKDSEISLYKLNLKQI